MLNIYNPDVLTCIANLSNDRVFTPPKIAKQVLDTLPSKIWHDKNITFCDPFTKSGVFLREITIRLIDGLESQIPNLEERVDHILRNQVFGLGIDELTSLMSRRTLYCSKYADGKYSIVSFENSFGNINYIESQHNWGPGNRCTYCGVNENTYNRGEEKESYAYSFLHCDDVSKLFDMKFDVIVGNPPYQMNDGGGMGSSATPIYDQFVENAIKLNPNYISMIIPSRWFTGGRGLDKFRKKMLNDDRIKEIHDFPNAADCFTGPEIKGGVCYFLWDKNYKGDCTVFTHSGDEIKSKRKRPLLEPEMEIFIRDNDSISILKKIQKFEEETFDSIVSSNDPFGFDKREEGSYRRVQPKWKLKPFKNSVDFYHQQWRISGIGHIDKESITKNKDLLGGYKIFIPKAWGVGNASIDRLKPILVGPNTCCTETYLMIGPYNTKKEIEMINKFIQTKFFHYLVSLCKNTQNAMKKVYSLVPLQDFTNPISDEYLFKKYNLSNKEIKLIENTVRNLE